MLASQVLMLGVTACKTVKGLGGDIQSVGQAGLPQVGGDAFGILSAAQAACGGIAKGERHARRDRLTMQQSVRIAGLCFKRVAKGGRVVWLRATYNPLYDAGGRLYGVIKFATDITNQIEHREAEGERDAHIIAILMHKLLIRRCQQYSMQLSRRNHKFRPLH